MNRRPQETQAGRPFVVVRFDQPAAKPKPKKPAETDEQRYRRLMGSEADIVARGNRNQAREAKEAKLISRTGTGYGSYRKPR